MRTIRIYHEAGFKKDQLVTLSKPASQHLSKVLRLTTGAELILFNGKGDEYGGEITSAKKDAVQVLIKEATSTPSKESPLQLELVQAIPNSGKMDIIIQKAVELGVTQITPIISEYCSIKLSPERWAKKMCHWEKIIINACEQSERSSLPQLNEPRPFINHLANCTAEQKLILHPRTQTTTKPDETTSSVALFIGPEGGFSQQEVDLALSQQYAVWSLGPRILRTETAAISAMTLAQAKWGDL